MSRWPRLVVMGALSLALGCEGRARTGTGEPTTSVSEPHVAELDLTAGVPEEASGGLFDASHGESLADLLLGLQELRDDDAIKGLFVRLRLTSVGFAQAEAIGRALAAMPADKPVICHADGYGNGSMMLAALGCDEIWLSPAGGVETVGIAGQLLFGKSLLDRLEIDVDFLQEGRFKGASEMYTRDSASAEARASLRNALGAIRTAWRDSVAEARGKSAADLGLEDGPHTPEAALARGLVDELGYEREARARALERTGTTDTITRFGATNAPDGDFGGLLRLLGDGDGLDVPHVAVLRATGAITMSGGGSLFGGGDGISERALAKRIRALEEDEAVVAVVLRIDSPGGSALASDRLWTHLMALRAKKPLVVSIGGMAASGGYYMACAGTKVVAERTSIIGSIGVVGGKLSFARTLANVGVHVETVPATEDGNARAVYASPFSPWDDATRDKVAESMRGFYALFLKRIATGRALDVAAIEPYAEGRLMGGAQAVDAKLADEVGGMERAIELARELAKVPESTAVEIVGGRRGLLDLLADSPNASATVAVAALQQEQRRQALALLGGPLGSFQPEIETFVASTLPLFEGERVLVALPFVLAVR